jgi:molybdopterin-guanine dinucleotide biosynthesis protein A
MITIVLQAGGKSTRMGEDKALKPFLGIPLVARLRDRFSKLGLDLMVITNDFTGYEELGLPLYQDLIPDRGVLGGLYTALYVPKTPYVGLIAADLPFADAELVLSMLTRAKESGADAVIPSTDKGIEPLHAVYRKETCLPLVKTALDQDLWKMTSWHPRATIQFLSAAETQKMTSSDLTFWNLNTPEDFKNAEKIAQELNLV